MKTQASAALSGSPAKGIRSIQVMEKAILNVVMFVLALSMVLPFIWMMLSTFKPYQEIISIQPSLWPKEFTFLNYRTLVEELPFTNFFLNSVFVSTTITLVILFVSSLCGYVFAKFDFAL